MLCPIRFLAHRFVSFHIMLRDDSLLVAAGSTLSCSCLAAVQLIPLTTASLTLPIYVFLLCKTYEQELKYCSELPWSSTPPPPPTPCPFAPQPPVFPPPLSQYFTVPPLFLLESGHTSGIRRNPVESSGIQRNGTGFQWIPQDCRLKLK